VTLYDSCMDLTARVLEDDKIRLEPLTREHLAEWCRVGLDADIWKWYTIAPITTPEMMRDYIELLLNQQAEGTTIPFVTRDKVSGRVVGGTRYLNIEPERRKVEIGSTWIGREWRRTHVNSHAKLLMLRYAFGTLGCVRVELRTDALNAPSRAAIGRLGATFEGILRKHAETASGRWRDTAVFSILDSEWPAVRAGLEARIAGHAAANA